MLLCPLLIQNISTSQLTLASLLQIHACDLLTLSNCTSFILFQPRIHHSIVQCHWCSFVVCATSTNTYRRIDLLEIFFFCITTKAHLTSDSSVLSMFKKHAQTFLFIYNILHEVLPFLWSCPICNLIMSSGSLYLHCLCMCVSICRKYGWSEPGSKHNMGTASCTWVESGLCPLFVFDQT